MGRFIWENDKFIYMDQNEEKVLLDCGDYLSNKSRLPMHRLSEQDPFLTLPGLITGLMKKIQCENGSKVFSYILIDFLLADRLIRSSRPFHVLEYGCQDGLLSSQMAELIGALNEESSFVCAHDAIEMGWLERISRIDKLPKMSYLAGDPGHLQLQQKYFDIVVINGPADYDGPLEVLRDVLELVAEDGDILCYVDNTPLLESTFKLFFEEREEYEFTPVEKILVAKAKDRCWETDKEDDIKDQIQLHLKAAQGLLDRKEKQTKIAEMIEVLRQDGREAARRGIVDLKKQILHQKERMITYLIELER